MLMEPRDVYWWDLPRVLSPEEHDAIDERLAAAEAAGTLNEEKEKDENKKSDVRPVLVFQVMGSNVIVGMLTTQDYGQRGAVRIEPTDFLANVTAKVSFFRPERIWTDHTDWARRKMGTLSASKFEECRAAVRALFS